MRHASNMSEISAEMLLNFLYPEEIDQWVVKDKGTFYRNYTPDVLSVDAKARYVALSRDGFIKLLPQGLITTDNELKGDDFYDKYVALFNRKQLLQEVFKPIDSFTFRRRLHIERKVSQLLNDKATYLLKKFYHFDLSKEKNPYVKTLAMLLPNISKLRANFGIVRDLLQILVGCEVEMNTGRYSEKDDTRCWLPWLKYDLLIDDLTTPQYNLLRKDMLELEQFINEWFMPFDVKCSLRIKQHGYPCKVEENLTLDYNTELK